MTRKLTLRELNRTSLKRQLLLERHNISVIEAVDKLIGLQSQVANPPYIGLWTRLEHFTKDNLTQSMQEKKIVRAAMMRSTLHLVTAEMHQKIQGTIQPALVKGFRSFFSKYRDDVDVERLVAAAKPFLETAPRTTGELRDFLLTIQPDVEPNAMAYAVRTYLPLVQVSPSGIWGTGTRATYIPADMWLDNPQEADLKALFKMYLSAFGPATIMDFQAFVGLTSLTKTITSWKDDFVIYFNEDGKELFDLPEQKIVDADLAVPIRFLPEYDNAVISYKDRNRILADEHRKQVFLSAARVLGTILVDGFVAATWKFEREKDIARLRITCFDDLSSDVRDEITAEGERLLRFIEEDAENYELLYE